MLTAPIAWGQTIGNSLFARRNAGAVAAQDAGKAFTPIPDVYALRKAYYAAAQYDLLRPYGTGPASVSALPRTIRGVLQIVRPAVDWWKDNLYRGTWTSDGRPSATGKPNMIPWEADAPDEVVLAAQTAFGWGNFAQRGKAYTYYGPVCGDVFGEIEVDYARQKAYPVFYDPSAITHLVLNGSGDVTSYRIAVRRYDPQRKQAFTWAKLVTKSIVVTFYNDHEQGFETVTLRDGTTDLAASDTVPAEVPNAFGFAPGVWVNHAFGEGVHGAPAIDGMYGPIDEINGLQSAINDYVMRIANQKIIVSSEDPQEMLKTIQQAVDLGATADLTNPSKLRDAVNIWPAPPNVTAIRMLEDVGLEASVAHIDRLMRNIEANLPEATIEERLSQAGDVTGPGARAIVAPVQRKLDAVVPGYDHGIEKLGQMSVSIVGELLNRRVFSGIDELGLPIEGIDAFRDFDLRSWPRGELAALAVSPRDLVPPTMGEKAAEAAAAERLQSVWALKWAGLTDGDLYGTDSSGKPNEAPPDPGILAEREARRQEREAAAVGLFNRGGEA